MSPFRCQRQTNISVKWKQIAATEIAVDVLLLLVQCNIYCIVYICTLYNHIVSYWFGSGSGAVWQRFGGIQHHLAVAFFLHIHCSWPDNKRHANEAVGISAHAYISTLYLPHLSILYMYMHMYSTHTDDNTYMYDVQCTVYASNIICMSRYCVFYV